MCQVVNGVAAVRDERAHAITPTSVRNEVILPAIVAPMTRLSKVMKNGSELIAISLRAGYARYPTNPKT